MNTHSRWKYILLGVGAFLVVIFLVYLYVATYFHIPLVSLLPSTPLTQSLSTVSPTQGIKPTSVKMVTYQNGTYEFEVRGKFVAKPYYTGNILRGEFSIDEDPYGLRVPVILGTRGGTINIGRAKGSLSGTTIWKLEDTGALLTAIKPGAPALLRLVFSSGSQDQLEQSTLKGIMSGNWNISQDLFFNPMMVGVVE